MLSPPPEARDRRWVFPACAIAALALPLFFLHMSARPVTSILEERVAITSREMWRQDEWIVPTMNGELRLQKPPLAYWLVEICAAVRGEVDDITLRLPFSLLAIGTALFTWRIGRRLFGDATGLAAAIVMLTSAIFIKEARLSTADPAMLFSAAGAWCWYLAARETDSNGGASPWKRVAFYCFLGLGVLAKGPVILVLCVLPCIVEALFSRSWAPLRPFRSAPGIALFLILSLSWPVAVVWRLRVEGDTANAIRQWYLESFGKVLPSSGVEDGYKFQRHAGPWWFYLPRLFSAFSVWSPLLLVGLVRDARKKGSQGFPWLLFVVVLAFSSIVSEKKSAYMLPLAPTGALLVANVLVETYARYRAIAAKCTRWLALPAALALAVVVTGLVWPGAAARLSGLLGNEASALATAACTEKPIALVSLAAAPLLGCLIVSRLLCRESPVAALVGLGAVLAVTTAAYAEVKLLIPPEEGDMRRLIPGVASVLPSDAPLYSLGGQSAGAVGSLPGGLVYYLDRRVPLVDEKDVAQLSRLEVGARLFVSEWRLAIFTRPPGSTGEPAPRRWAAGERPGGSFGGFIVRATLNPETVNPRDRIYILEKTDRGA